MQASRNLVLDMCVSCRLSALRISSIFLRIGYLLPARAAIQLQSTSCCVFTRRAKGLACCSMA